MNQTQALNMATVLAALIIGVAIGVLVASDEQDGTIHKLEREKKILVADLERCMESRDYFAEQNAKSVNRSYEIYDSLLASLYHNRNLCRKLSKFK